MRATLKLLTGGGALVLAGFLMFPPTSRAQGPQAYYYPTAGTYATTAGPVVIPAPGYYYNVPARYAAPRAPYFAPTAPTWGGRWFGYGGAPSPRSSGVVRGYRPGGSTPYYQAGGAGGTPHYLHGRGYDSAGHR